ncbi:PDR/VanB family oxidoreductase [Salinibacterium sp. SYSU T00001]|uniref:PDR/VanB family oxidoreductase n=1 Tax=Homoserinimonas sedimenticola TaxID=2986805 RepID=UPI0022360C20|nr:PDR/VanB family oxidoreductase [Salinibacterium sedimenticola]MCW4385975.1 PDR/VanB family oxidoreductase [Salinibacterium sedimenticola]
MVASNIEVWQHATVVETSEIATGIRRIVLEPNRPVKADPGTHLDLMVTIDGRPERRSYSIVDASPDGRRVALSVFRTPASRGGSIAMHALQVGDVLEVTQPLQNFPLRHGAPRYLLLAGGVGITAIVAMARALARVKAEFTLVYAGRSRAAMAYLAELEAELGDRIRIHVDDEGTTMSVAGLVEQIAEDTEVYMCGPIRLMDAVRRAWNDRGLPPQQLRYETFGASGWFDPQEFTVRIPRLGVETVVPKGRSMLEALEEAGVDMMFDCRRGECGLCEVRVLDLAGDVDHRDVFYSDRQKEARAKMCCCVSRAVSATDAPAVVSIEVS